MSYRPLIYTAGKMDWPHREYGRFEVEDTAWRRSVELDSETARFIHPGDRFLDHGGDLVWGSVVMDMEKLREADGVLAFFDQPHQMGTVVETVYAAALGKRVLAVFTPELITESAELPCRADLDNAGEERLVQMRGNGRRYWFVHNFLAGDYEGRGWDEESTPTRDWLNGQRTQVWHGEEQHIPAILDHWVGEVY